ncbi:MAG TPA: hypothetical protein VGN54_07430, partial [Mycobacteriales bacterium]|nr:hypothetical protein [Mycobacteriales bacterium]
PGPSCAARGPMRDRRVRTVEADLEPTGAAATGSAFELIGYLQVSLALPSPPRSMPGTPQLRITP